MYNIAKTNTRGQKQVLIMSTHGGKIYFKHVTPRVSFFAESIVFFVCSCAARQSVFPTMFEQVRNKIHLSQQKRHSYSPAAQNITQLYLRVIRPQRPKQKRLGRKLWHFNECTQEIPIERNKK